ncbi:MAG: hypothetical protein JXR58_03880, partial [Bacteroidales bacterium]|nr:hypothetical protein [Bacteroidales bacterium]
MIIVFSVIAALTAGFLILKQYMPEHNWQPTLSHKSSHPYGTSYLYNLLKESYDEDDFMELKKRPQKIIPDSDTNSLLFYIGYNSFFDSLSIEWIRKYMINGNKVCFASNQLP